MRILAIACMVLLNVVSAQTQKLPEAIGTTNPEDLLQAHDYSWDARYGKYYFPEYNPADPFNRLNDVKGTGRREWIDPEADSWNAHFPREWYQHHNHFPEPNQARRPQSPMKPCSNDSVYEAWVNYYASGLIPACDNATDIAIDDLGYVYVTGYSSDLPYGRLDYLTAKYDTSGILIWTVRYNGIGNGEDIATAVCVDASGNVYVTGYSYGDPGTGYDYATVKYDAAGVEQWVARYNGAGNGDDMAWDLALDNSGNVYVTGESYGSGTDADYATVKYDTAGVEQWVARYDGYNNWDRADALALDASGNVYVTGVTFVSYYTGDYCTIKYNAAGVEQWVAFYDGPGNGDDGAWDLALDASGNVYVTGHSYGSGTDADYATVKYDTAGVEQWVARYNSPVNGRDMSRALVLDDSGNIYVTGSVFDPASYTQSVATVKYNAAGVEQWVASYFGGNRDYVYDIAVDDSANVYVTGYSLDPMWRADYVTVKYDAAGVEQWVARYEGLVDNSDDRGYALVVDNSGNIYVTGGSGGYDYFYCYKKSDYATIKYNSAGVEQWVDRYDGPGSSYDETCAIALDNSGNIYVTGISTSAGTSKDYLTIKYDAAGVEQWVANYNGPINGMDEASAIAVDEFGNVYVTGTCMMDSMSNFDYCTIKYNAAGVEQWVARYDGYNTYDAPSDLALDDSGNVYVTGYISTPDWTADYCTIKYDAAGVEQWVAIYNGPDNVSDQAYALALDESGNVYVTGTVGTADYQADCGTIKYNSAGIEQWVALYNGPSNGFDGAMDIVVDESSNVYVTGVTTPPGVWEQDYLTIKYDAAGVEQWVAIYNGPSDDTDFTRGIGLDASGNIYVTGSSYDFVRDFDYVTVKYDNDGIEQWITSYDGGGWDDPAFRSGLAVDDSGNVYVTGFSDAGGSEYRDFATVKYSSAGVEQWVARNNGPGNSQDALKAAIAVDDSENVYVTGSSSMEWSIATTIKYVQEPHGIQEAEVSMPSGYRLTQNYPSPFNSSTTICYALPKSCNVTLKIYNTLGQEIETLVNSKQLPGVYEVQWNPENLPNGVYFYSLQAGEFKETKKTILLLK